MLAEVIVQVPFADLYEILLVNAWLFGEMFGLSILFPALQYAAGDCSAPGSSSQCGRNGRILQGGNCILSHAPLKSSNQGIVRNARPRDEPPRVVTWNPTGSKEARPAKKRRKGSSCRLKYS